MTLPLLLGVLLLHGCGESVRPLYDEHRAFALTKADSPRQGWHPDAVMLLSKALVSDALSAALKDALEDPEPIAVGRVATVTPKGKVKRVTLTAPKDACEGCVTFKANLEGNALVVAGRVEREVPFVATIAASLAFSTKEVDGVRVLEAEVKELRRAEIELSGRVVREVDLNDIMQKWSAERMGELPRITLGEVGGEDLMLRDLRVLPSGKGLKLELLTTAAHGAALKVDLDAPASGWQAAVSEATLLDLARVEAFKQGELDMDIHAEPTSLDVEGERFTLGLRLWRLNNPGWWRDYKITGTITVPGKTVAFKADGVEEVATSDGAGLADPLALLGESFILQALQDAAAGALPSQTRSDMEGIKLAAQVKEARGEGDHLIVSGIADVSTGQSKRTTKPTVTRGSEKKR